MMEFTELSGKRVLFALDLEGVNYVVGEPYKGLVKGCEQWEIARREAAWEVNTAACALFDSGAAAVDLWDNHGGGSNIDPADLDPRIRLLTCDTNAPRMYFAPDYDCVCYFGYHAMEGTLGGVLAHTMSSVQVQFYKLDGAYIGEIDMDARIAASHGVPSCFFAGGDIACAQAARAVPGIRTVITKQELGRNEAVFRDREALAKDLRQTIVEAVCAPAALVSSPYPAVMEKSFKRVEDAAAYLEKLRALGIDACHPEEAILGADAHTVAARIHHTGELIACI